MAFDFVAVFYLTLYTLYSHMTEGIIIWINQKINRYDQFFVPMILDVIQISKIKSPTPQSAITPTKIILVWDSYAPAAPKYLPAVINGV